MVIAGVYYYLLPTYSVIPLPLASSSVGCVFFFFLPAVMTQTFILEECRPLVVLPGLAYNFPLTLITEPDNTK